MRLVIGRAMKVMKLGAGMLALGLLVISLALMAPAAGAAVSPEQDPFYSYEGSTPLANIAPGTVLKTRTLSYHVAGVPLPIKAVQLLYRSTGETGQPTVNVTSVLQPPLRLGAPTIVSYQSFYDSLNPEDEPSYAISGGVTLGGLIPTAESGLIAPALLAGETVVVPDTEGETADFAAGPEYGMNTLDSLRAVLSSPASGAAGAKQIGLIGYSGGAIATGWAAELASSYAPDISSRIVGAAMGGVLVDPAHNLHYVEGSTVWAGVIPMSVIGISRAFHVDLTPYLNEYGLQLYNKLQRASIETVLGEYPGLTWAQMAKPEYQTPGERARLRRSGEPADHGQSRHAQHADVHRPGQRRRTRRNLGQQGRHRSRRRRDDRGRCAQPCARVLQPRRLRAVRGIRTSQPRSERGGVAGRSRRLARRTFRRAAGAAELLEHRAGQLAGADDSLSWNLIAFGERHPGNTCTRPTAPAAESPSPSSSRTATLS